MRMSTDEPQPKRVCLAPNQKFQQIEAPRRSDFHGILEQHFSKKCLCDLNQEDLLDYINRNFTTISKCDTQLPDSEDLSSILLFLGFLAWISETYHEQLSSGSICSSIHRNSSYIINRTEDLLKLLLLLRARDEYLQYSSSQAIFSLLPLCHCGTDNPLQFSNRFLQKFKEDFFDNPQPSRSSDSLLESICPGESASLDDFFFGEPSSSSQPKPRQRTSWLERR